MRASGAPEDYSRAIFAYNHARWYVAEVEIWARRYSAPASVQTAAARGLDFIAITDHNADSQNDALRELQPYFDRVLLIPGREMTTLLWALQHLRRYTVY